MLTTKLEKFSFGRNILNKIKPKVSSRTSFSPKKPEIENGDTTNRGHVSRSGPLRNLKKKRGITTAGKLRSDFSLVKKNKI